MRRFPRRVSMAFAALWSCLVPGASAADILVIANPSVKISAISSEDLKGVFLQTRTVLGDGSHVEPVLLTSGTVHQAFTRQYVGKTEVALETYYRSLVFTGKALMPRMLRSEEQVLEYVAKTKGAVGYVGTGVTPAGVRVLDVR